jgi:hypothetical protein
MTYEMDSELKFHEDQIGLDMNDLDRRAPTSQNRGNFGVTGRGLIRHTVLPTPSVEDSAVNWL